MNNMSFPNTDKRAVMEGMRDRMKDNSNLTNSEPVSNEANFQTFEDIQRNIMNATELAGVGTKLPPMYRLKGIKRTIGKLVGNIFLRIGQIITRDQRAVNYSLLEAISLLTQEVNTQRKETREYLNLLETQIQSLFELKSNNDNKLAGLEERLKAKNNQQIKILDEFKQEVSSMEEQVNNSRVLDEIKEDFKKEIVNLEKNINDEIKEDFKKEIVNLEKYINDEIKEDFKKEIVNLEKYINDEVSSGANYLKNNVSNLNNRLDGIVTSYSSISTKVRLQENRLSLLLEEARKRLPEPFNEEQLKTYSNTMNTMNDTLYVAFEDIFRGNRQEIKDRLSIYIPIIKDSNLGTNEFPVLDIGCGRGEWLELLNEQNLISKGIDINQAMITQCIGYGLDAKCTDMFEYLSRQLDNSIGVVTGFHIIEHLSFEKQIKFLDEITRVLKPGGLTILETPNPKNVLVGSCNFYTDPTHKNPVFPGTIQFLAEMRGLSRVEIKELHPREDLYIPEDSIVAKRFNEHFYGAQDFAIVGWKA